MTLEAVPLEVDPSELDAAALDCSSIWIELQMHLAEELGKVYPGIEGVGNVGVGRTTIYWAGRAAAETHAKLCRVADLLFEFEADLRRAAKLYSEADREFG